MAETDRRYDVAVIGAGPAGAVFAMRLGQMRPDLHILLIDGQTEHRKKVCGGLLAPDAQKVLASFGLTLPNSVLANPQIFAVDTLDLSSGIRRLYQRNYLNMDRYAFDRWLLSLVGEHVTVIGGRCTKITNDENGFSLTVEGREYRTASVVGADGANSLVRRTFFHRRLTQYTAVQARYPDPGVGIPSYSCLFDPVTSDSCSWTIRKDGYLIFGGAFAKQGCRDAFVLQKQRLEERLGCTLGEPFMSEACLVTSPRHFRDFICGIPGVYLIGEAGGFISASSFEGISAAMLCGRYLAQAFAKGSTQADILRRYRRLTQMLRLKLWSKTFKRAILCSPLLRYFIMKSGIQSMTRSDVYEHQNNQKNPIGSGGGHTDPAVGLYFRNSLEHP